MSIGVAEATIVSPREVFRDAILNGASRIMMLHDHPSGNAEPFREDLVVKSKLDGAGEPLAVTVIDLAMFGGSGRYRSNGDDNQ